MGGGSLFCNTEVRSNPIFICSFLRLIASLFARCAGLCDAQSHTLAVAIIKKLFFKVTSLISLFRCRLLHCGRHSLNLVSNQINRILQQHGRQEIGIYLRISISVIRSRPSSQILFELRTVKENRWKSLKDKVLFSILGQSSTSKWS